MGIHGDKGTLDLGHLHQMITPLLFRGRDIDDVAWADNLAGGADFGAERSFAASSARPFHEFKRDDAGGALGGCFTGWADIGTQADLCFG